jgi:hypothetical protein
MAFAAVSLPWRARCPKPITVTPGIGSKVIIR